ncbi:MAG: MBL fold metallo-hydrolase [Treponema sp.]|nr:MBL fold metallo-hydrolase [Treponema sp.]
MEAVRIAERISYIPATENPLSADVGIIEGDDAVWFYDVGSNENVADFIENYKLGLNSKSEPKKKIAVISHFHTDHTANLTKVKFDKIYMGKQTLRYFQIIRASQGLHEGHGEGAPKLTGDLNFPFEEVCQIVTDKIEIDDGIKLTVSEIPSSHSKGSLCFQAGDYAFLGDATFYGFKHKKKFYNVQLLQQEIEALRQIDASVFLLSHRRNFTKQKRAVITLLEQIYETRKSGDTEIEIF